MQQGKNPGGRNLEAMLRLACSHDLLSLLAFIPQDHLPATKYSMLVLSH